MAGVSTKVTASNPWRIRIKELLPLRHRDTRHHLRHPSDSEVVIIKEYAKKFFKDTSILERQGAGEFGVDECFEPLGQRQSRHVTTVNGDLRSGLCPCCGADHYEAPA